MYKKNIRWECYTQKIDNLLVDMDIFTVLEVSCCVTRNTFNFIDIKNKNIVDQFNKSSIQLRSHFLIY